MILVIFEAAAVYIPCDVGALVLTSMFGTSCFTKFLQ